MNNTRKIVSVKFYNGGTIAHSKTYDYAITVDDYTHSYLRPNKKYFLPTGVTNNVIQCQQIKIVAIKSIKDENYPKKVTMNISLVDKEKRIVAVSRICRKDIVSV